MGCMVGDIEMVVMGPPPGCPDGWRPSQCINHSRRWAEEGDLEEEKKKIKEEGELEEEEERENEKKSFLAKGQKHQVLRKKTFNDYTSQLMW